MDAFEGYAVKNGVKRPCSLSDDEISELRRMIDDDNSKPNIKGQ